MSNPPKIYKFKTIGDVVNRVRDDLNNHDCVLLFAHNGTGKTRLSMEFKTEAKRSTLYFNAFTEDLFWWDNDLEGDSNRYLQLNSESKFFRGLEELALETKISFFLEKFANFDFKIDYKKWRISFHRNDEKNIKISRGEENIFIWSLFLAIYELAIDEDEAYSWVKNVYIDDPISSLDDGNAILVAVDLARLMSRGKDKLKVILSTHHTLFHNVIFNEIKNKKLKRKCYFYHRPKNGEVYTLRCTRDTPFFHHVAMLAELKKAKETNEIYTYHFNVLRSIMEKTASFFGYEHFKDCIQGMEEGALFERALQLLSHGTYSIYEPIEMIDDNKDLFKRLLDSFLERYSFNLNEILGNEEVTS